jgi:Type II secretion system (T2SS), protein E, N-terminal domain
MARDSYDGDDAEWSRDLARRYGSEFVGLDGFRIPRGLLKKVPVELMFRYNFVPLEETQDGKLAIAIADPSQLLMIDEITLLLHRSVVTKVSTLKQIFNILKKTEQSQHDKDE